MFLCSTDKKLLKAMKEAQRNEAGYVAFLEWPYCCHCSGFTFDDVHQIDESVPRIKIDIDQTSCKPALQSLKEKGLIKHFGGTYKVTHDGWNNKALNRNEYFKMVMTHFLFPCVVALITTLLTLFLCG